MNDLSVCECGCGETVSPGSRFRQGHWARVRPSQTSEERFWSKVDKRGPDECWEWQAATSPDGYGFFWDSEIQGMVRPHRWIAARTFGGIEARKAGEIGCGEILVCHTCDNPRCVNPAHLYIGTPADNMEDRSERGRNPDYRGHRNPKAKLTAEQVAEIRNRYTGAYGEQSALAREFGVNPQTVRHIVRGETWASAS